MWSASTFTGSLPNACTASQWNSTFFSRQIAPIWRTGCNTPISLLAYITLTSTVSGPIASRNWSRSTRPSGLGRRIVTRQPASSSVPAVSSTALCSVATVTICARPDTGGSHHTLQRQIVRFRRAAREHDLARARPGQVRHPLARHLHCRFRFPSEAVRTACGIAEFRPEKRKHRFQNTRIHRRGGVIIQINGLSHTSLSHTSTMSVGCFRKSRV